MTGRIRQTGVAGQRARVAPILAALLALLRKKMKSENPIREAYAQTIVKMIRLK